ncbi:hypothetical protein EGH22_12940 [Halomicroarcula sp. F28]|uniref:hypothetical protein n=1 Tax=Haloarcula salinisoli TaxID=2487746 RepID=UPI001C730769|nr:hypothetical protein [Halomicroarcula salinisoli]MBX0287238.1 hypothetical protein [Halomicroarcula salinisoli]
MPSTARTAAVTAVAFVLGMAAVSSGAIYALPPVSDGTGPTDIEITDLERLDAGCREDVATYASSRNGPNGTYERTSFVETGTRDATLSAWAERTSPVGADYSTFRVNVESDRTGPANETCEVGVQYRLEYRTSGGTDDGLVPDASGHSITHVENGRFAGCSSVGGGRWADAGCPHSAEDRPARTWANATG